MTEILSYDQEEKGGKGASLMETYGGFEKSGQGSIDEDGKGGTLDTSHYPVDNF
jgi:hypothetical protein